MLALSVQFLTGRYVATAHNDRDRSEWPPHPARLFSALTDAWGSTEQPDDDERAVLEDLERLGPPQISAPTAVPRTVVTHYVPINDQTVITANAVHSRAQKLQAAQAVLADPKSAARARAAAMKAIAQARDVESLVHSEVSPNAPNPYPDKRGKRPRTFPSYTLGSHPLLANTISCDWVHFIWPDAQLSASRQATLDALLARVVRLGHSSSLVNCTITNQPGEPTHLPSLTADGVVTLRTVLPGQLNALCAEYGVHQASRPRSLPHARTNYVLAGPGLSSPMAVSTALRGEWYAFELYPDGANKRGIRPEALVGLTWAWRNAIADRLDERQPGLDRCYFIGLPRVGYRGNGDLLGAALVIPESLAEPAKKAIRRAVGSWRQDVAQVRVGDVQVRFADDTAELDTLRPRTWGTDPAGNAARHQQDWATATPIAIPLRRPRTAADWAAIENWIASACLKLDLPLPAQVSASGSPILNGSLPARSYPPFQHNGRRAFLTHARIHFDSPIVGAMLLGIGRHLGLGLLKPVGD